MWTRGEVSQWESGVELTTEMRDWKDYGWEIEKRLDGGKPFLV
jgi:hypothetical protein